MQKPTHASLIFSRISIVSMLTVGVVIFGLSGHHKPVQAQSTTFLENFTGSMPAAPQFFRDSPLAFRWDITTHSRDGAGGGFIGSHDYSQLEFAFMAQHGDDCSPPMNMHSMQSYEAASFICKEHIMTSMYAPGAGIVALTPDHMVDISQGTATIQFRVSTLRTSGRDYWQINFTPWDTHHQLVQGAINADLNGQPPKSLVINQALFDSGFPVDGTIEGYQVAENFVRTPLNRIYVPRPEMPYGVGPQSYNRFLTPSATNRDLFEIKLSKTHVSICMPEYPNEACFIDTELAQPLDWNTGIVQFSHISYNPTKNCSQCSPNTLHWDDFMINPAVPFTIDKATQRSYMSEASCPTCETEVTVNLNQPAPPLSKLHFAALAADDAIKTDQWSSLQVSFDGGATWKKALSQKQDIGTDNKLDDWTFWSYFTGDPANGGYVPTGVQTIKIKGLPSARAKIASANGQLWVRDVSLFSETATYPSPTVPLPSPSGSPTPLIGDLTMDGIINAADYTLFTTKFNESLPSIADIDNDNDIDIYDLNYLVEHFGQTAP